MIIALLTRMSVALGARLAPTKDVQEPAPPGVPRERAPEKLPKGLHWVDDHGKRYVQCSACIAKRGRRVARGSGVMAVAILLGAALISAGIVMLGSHLLSSTPEPSWTMSWSSVAELAKIPAPTLLSALGVLVTLMIAVAVATGQSSRQISELESTVVEKDIVDLAKLYSLRRNDTRLMAEFSLSLLCIAVSLIIALAAGQTNQALPFLVCIMALMCAVWAAFQATTSEMSSQRGTSLRFLLDKDFRDNADSRLSGVKDSGYGGAVFVLSSFVGSTIFVLAIGGDTPGSSVLHGLVVVLSLSFVCFVVTVRLGGEGMGSAGLTRWFPPAIAGALSTILLIAVWTSQVNRFEALWEVIAFFIVLLGQIALTWLIALGSAGSGPAKAVAKRYTGLPKWLRGSTGSPRPAWWLATAAVPVLVPAVFRLADSGVSPSLQLLVLGGLLFGLNSRLLAFYVFVQGALRRWTLISCVSGAALHLAWLWSSSDQLIYRLVGCGFVAASYAWLIALASNGHRRWVAPLIYARLKREKTTKSSVPRQQSACGFSACGSEAPPHTNE